MTEDEKRILKFLFIKTSERGYLAIQGSEIKDEFPDLSE